MKNGFAKGFAEDNSIVRQNFRGNLAEERQEQHTSILNSTCLILKYNRIAQLRYDPLQMAVWPHIFEEQMGYLSQHCKVISLGDMLDCVEQSRPFDANSAAVTFDIGYADVLNTAKEILERFHIPATVFTSTACIEGSGDFWWDVLENRIIANRAGEQLEIYIDGRNYCWPLKTQRERFQAYDELYSMMCYMSADEHKAIIEQISCKLRIDTDEIDNHRTMNAQELKRLEDGGLISIGGHTHNGVDLSLLPKNVQIEEISQNKQVLEEITGHSIEYFSYPFTAEQTYMPETVGILKGAGYELACGNSNAAVNFNTGTRLYNLPRVKVGNCNTFAFYRFLEGFFRN